MERVEPQRQGEPSFTVTFHGSGNAPTIRPGQGGGQNPTGQAQGQGGNPVHHHGQNYNGSTNYFQDSQPYPYQPPGGPLDYGVPVNLTAQERSNVPQSSGETGGGGQAAHPMGIGLLGCDWFSLPNRPGRPPVSFGKILISVFIVVTAGKFMEVSLKDGKGVTNNGTFGLSGLFADKSDSSEAPTEPGFAVGVKSCYSCLACPKPHTTEDCPNDGNRYSCVTYEVYKEDKAFVSRGCAKVSPEAKEPGSLRGCTLEAHNIKACYCDQDNCNWRNYSDNEVENEVKESTEGSGSLKEKVEFAICSLILIFIIYSLIRSNQANHV